MPAGLPLVNVSELMAVLPVYSCTLNVITWSTRAKVGCLAPVMVTVVALWAEAGAATRPVSSSSAAAANPRTRRRTAFDENDPDKPTATPDPRGPALCFHMCLPPEGSATSPVGQTRWSARQDAYEITFSSRA